MLYYSQFLHCAPYFGNVQPTNVEPLTQAYGQFCVCDQIYIYSYYIIMIYYILYCIIIMPSADLGDVEQHFHSGFFLSP